MEQIFANITGKTRRATIGGRQYIVAPLSLIVPGVLNGSQGPLYYPPEEVAKDPSAWNGVPIVVYHPQEGDQNISARDPGVIDKQGVGYVYHARSNGKLTAESWFDIEDTRRVDSRILAALEAGRPIEISTGLFTSNEPAPEGASHNGTPYTHVARNYRPDHLAVLPDLIGACSIQDGCGVLVNESKQSIWQKLGELLGISTNTAVRLVGTVGEARKHIHLVSLDEDGYGYTNFVQQHSHRVKAFKVLPQEFPEKSADKHVHSLERGNLVDSGERIANVTKKEGAENLPASAYAYVPDADKPSTWKLRIDDAIHVGGAVAAIGKGYRGQKVQIPAGDMPAVKRKIRAAWLKFHPGKSREDLPPVLRNRRSAMTDDERKKVVDNLITNSHYWTEEDRSLLSEMTDEELGRLRVRSEKNQEQEAVCNAARKSFEDEQGTSHAFNEKTKKWESQPKRKEPVVNKDTGGKDKGEEKPPTNDEWLEAAPPEIQSAVRNAMVIEAREKRQIIERLTENVADEEKAIHQKRLETRSLEDLRSDLALLPSKRGEPVPAVNYYGAAAPTGAPGRPDEKNFAPFGLPDEYIKEEAAKT